MDDLTSYIILPINGDEPIQLFPSFNASLSGSSNEKVYTNIEYLTSQNAELHNIYVYTNDSLPMEAEQSITTTTTKENIDINESVSEDPNTSNNVDNDNENKSNQNASHQECLKCKKVFNKISTYQKHILTHKEEKLFSCKTCNTGFNFENNFKLHMALHESSLICPVCSVMFQRMASFKSHLSVHQVDEFYICPECSSEYDNMADLRKHMKSHTQEVMTQPKELVCNYCKVKFESPTLLEQHISSHMEVKKRIVNGKRSKRTRFINMGQKHKCSVCNKTFPKLSLLTRHTRIHSGERPYKCKLCAKGFTQKGTLKIHLMKHEDSKPFGCTLCPAKFNQKCNLKAHVQKTHTATTESEKIFKCSECDCIFKKVASLNGHMTKMHATENGEISITSVIDQLKILKEKLYGKSSESSSLVKDTENNHIEMNTEEVIEDRLAENIPNENSNVYSLKQKIVGTTKVYVCCFCDHETKKPSDLIRHLRTHTKEKPFKCHCGRAFSLKSTLSSHMQIHKTKIGKKCAECCREFVSTKAWNSHMRKHDETSLDSSMLEVTGKHQNLEEMSQPYTVKEEVEKNAENFKCQICLASFRQKVHLIRHSKLHTEGKRCQFCASIFSSATDLEEHMLLSHAGSKSHSCEVCSENFASDVLLNQHISIHNTIKPHCKKKVKGVLMNRKHIDNNNKSCEQQDALCESNTICTEKNDSEQQIANHSTTILHVDSNGVILNRFYGTDENNAPSGNPELGDIQCIDNGMKVDPTLLEFERNEDVPTIFVGYPEVQEGDGLSNYFFSQLNLQPCDTIVLNSGDELEESPIVFDVQTMNNGVLPVVDNMDNHLDSPEKSTNAEANLSQNEELLTENENINSIVASDENCLPEDFTEDFLADNISLYNTTQVSYDNSTEITSIPINLITSPKEDDRNNKGNTLNIINVSVTEAQENMNLNVIHCLVCKKLFDNITIYKSHVCLKSVLRKSHDISKVTETIEEEIRNQETFVDKDQHPVKPSSAKPKPVKTKRHFICVHCNKEFSNRGAYLRHAQTHPKNGNMLHQCKYCGKEFKKPSDLSRHLRTHTGEKPFACDQCDKKFSLKSTLEGHFKTHNPGASKDFICEVCNSCFSSKSSRKLHMLVHTGAKPHKCIVCDQHFRTAAHRRSHERRTHLNVTKKGKVKPHTLVQDMEANSLAEKDTQRQGSTNITEIQLEFPDQTDPTIKLTESIQIDQALLQQLQNSNILLQDFEPEVLGDASVIRIHDSNLKNLEKTEMVNALPYEINVEGMKLETDRDLECEVCHKKYACEDVLRKHKQLHLKNKFVCEQCNKWFSSIEALLKHEKLHSGYRPYSCFLCTNSFAELQHLKSHLKRIHQIADTSSPLILKMSIGETPNM